MRGYPLVGVHREVDPKVLELQQSGVSYPQHWSLSAQTESLVHHTQRNWTPPPCTCSVGTVHNGIMLTEVEVGGTLG